VAASHQTGDAQSPQSIVGMSAAQSQSAECGGAGQPKRARTVMMDHRAVQPAWDGYLPAIDRPGLSIEFDRGSGAGLQEFRMTPARRYVSFTNW